MPYDVGDFSDLPPGERGETRRNRRLIASWLFAICFMILVMVVLGGLTRLTGSGLSIMEWAPISGILPPLDHAQWEKLFALYKQIPQYRLVNDGFGLAGFQRIFWLEWTHRLWGRLIGIAVLVPLIWFWATGRLSRRLLLRMGVFFLLGGLQGAVGWFMVASGFFPDAVAVAPARLALHLALALALYAAILWTALSVLHPARRAPPATAALRRAVAAHAGLLALTILAGSIVAGAHAGLIFNSFPLMDGHLVPPGYARLHPFARNLIANLAAVQFDHRLLATLTALAALVVLALGARPAMPRFIRVPILALGALTAIQYALGVLTLLYVVPVALAALHQANAVLTLTAALVALHALRPPPIGPRFARHGAMPAAAPSVAPDRRP
ncbi:MAG: COX15/CtaA family protein [Rhodospirillales bacterium]|nr:COX15/CtaA family protein [Rhodospirillales bacterium]